MRLPLTVVLDLPYPALGLLIAASHERSAGHDVVTFEMLHDRFESQIRSSSAAPVQLGGVSIGMLKCPRSVVFAVSLLHNYAADLAY